MARAIWGTENNFLYKVTITFPAVSILFNYCRNENSQNWVFKCFGPLSIHFLFSSDLQSTTDVYSMMFIQCCLFKDIFFLVFLKLLFPVGSFGFDCFKSRHSYCWISLKQVKHSFLINLIATLKSVFCIPRSHRLNKMTGSNKNPFRREEKI